MNHFIYLQEIFIYNKQSKIFRGAAQPAAAADLAKAQRENAGLRF
jgi:hypothetical protein